MALEGWFFAEFRQLVTRVAMAEDVSAALVDLIAKVERVMKAEAPAHWRDDVESIRDVLRGECVAMAEADDARPPMARSPMQLRKRRLTEAAIAGLTTLLGRPSP